MPSSTVALRTKRHRARSRGDTEYNTGIPCRHGHASNRYVSTNSCVQCCAIQIAKTGSERGQKARFKKYGITNEVFTQMLTEQQSKCALCLVDFNLQQPATNKTPHIDHCHTTGEVRALLCSTCNSMLGFAKDNPALLRAGALYLEIFKE